MATLDFSDPVVRHTMNTLGYLEEDLRLKSREQLALETVIPREFGQDKTYFLEMKLAFQEEKR